MARPLATATISFGLVSIPVNLYSATQNQPTISFHLLHNTCKGRVKQQYICPHDDNQLVPREDMIKGYEFSKGKYVTFTPEELKAMEEKRTMTIDIAEFVPATTIDPIYYDTAYFLAPEQGAGRAYKLLAEAMKKTGRTALARYAARGKQYLVQLRPIDGGGIVLQQLLYSDEVRSYKDVPQPEGEVKESELKLAQMIIEQIAAEEFHPEKYHDDVKVRIQEQIDRKVAGQEIEAEPAEAPQAQIIDLMAALRSSLEKKVAANEGGDDGKKSAKADGHKKDAKANADAEEEKAEAKPERKKRAHR